MNPGDGKMVSSGGSFFPWSQKEGNIGGGAEPKGHDVLSLSFGLQFQEDEVSATQTTFPAFLDGTVAEATSPAQTVFVDSWTLVEAYGAGETITAEMSVTVTDACGTELSDSRGLSIEVEEGYYY
jgi:hypothetical protein